MPGPEGRNELYSILVSYFARAPRVVVYDFACALQDYCLNRAPGFFSHTTFVVDKFHWGNHADCGHGFDSRQYRAAAGLNSEVAEQCNSVMQKVKPSVSQMSQENYMAFFRFFMHVYNVRKIAKLERLQAQRELVALG